MRINRSFKEQFPNNCPVIEVDGDGKEVGTCTFYLKGGKCPRHGVIESPINEAVITYFNQPAKVNCDRNCGKAWGINGRPKVQLSADEDDYAYLADDELGIAPIDPGTYEGGVAKPLSPDEFPTKWCVRECERCDMSESGEWNQPLPIKDFSKRRFNMHWRELATEPEGDSAAS